VAAPIPEMNPLRNPFFRLREIQSTPIGPTGAAIEKPKPIPVNNKCNIENSWM
jgi:hypothetical protein